MWLISLHRDISRALLSLRLLPSMAMMQLSSQEWRVEDDDRGTLSGHQATTRSDASISIALWTTARALSRVTGEGT